MIVKPGDWNDVEGELYCCVGTNYEYCLNCFFQGISLHKLSYTNYIVYTFNKTLYQYTPSKKELKIYESAIEELIRL